LQVKAINDPDKLSCYADAWNRLALEAPQRLPTLSYAWVASFFDCMLLPGESWLSLMALEGERLVGALPVVISPHRVLGLSRPQIRTPCNDHSFSVDCLAARGREQEVVHLLLSSLLKIQPNIYGFSLNRLPDDSPTLSILRKGLAKAAVVREFNGFGCYLKVEGSLEDFRKGLSRNFTRNLNKARNKLGRLAETQTIVLTGSDSGEGQIMRFMKVEGSGWKGKTGTAIERSPALISFYSTLTSRLSRLGWLEWYFLTSGDRTIAGLLCIRMGRTLVLLKIGYEEEFAHCSPGNMLMEKVIERAFRKQDTDEINCLTDMAWLNNWPMKKKPHYNFWIYPSRPLPWIFGAMWQRTKIGLKRFSSVPPVYSRVRGLVRGEKRRAAKGNAERQTDES
jgi:CelD/BcsL family acetyltransferase involved in cellulose biosynthesis